VFITVRFMHPVQETPVFFDHPTLALTPEILHARFAKRITRHVRAVLGSDDEYEDLVQDVLVAVMFGIGTLRDPSCLDAWVARVTNNTLRNLMRRRSLRRHLSLETMAPDDEPSTDVKPETQDLAARALTVLSRLPSYDRALLTTYWFSPVTIGSMAHDAGCAVITMRRRLLRALGRFERLALRDAALASCIDGSVRETPTSDLEDRSTRETFRRFGRRRRKSEFAA
jgi:RNA polymerase sigma factor (sigma-70 family)